MKIPIQASHASAEFSASGKWILATEFRTANDDNSAILYDVKTGKELQRFEKCSNAFFTSNEREIVAVRSNKVVIIDVFSGDQVNFIDTNSLNLTNIYPTVDLKKVIIERSGHGEKHTYIYSLENFGLIDEFPSIGSFAISNENDQIAFVEKGNAVVVYDISNKEVQEAKYFDSRIAQISKNNSNDLLYILFENNHMIVVDFETLQIQQEFKLNQDRSYQFLFISQDGISVWWDPVDRNVVSIKDSFHEKSDGPSSYFSFNGSDQNTLVFPVIIDDTTIALINTLDTQETHIFRVNSPILHIDISEGKNVLVVLENRNILVYNTIDGKEECTISGETQKYLFNFQPDNTLLNYQNGKIRLNSDNRVLLDLSEAELINFSRNWEFISTLQYDNVLGWVPQIAFYRFIDTAYVDFSIPVDGQISSLSVHPFLSLGVVTTLDYWMPTEENKKARLIDLSTGEVKQILEGHSDVVVTSAFSRNGLLVATGGYDEKVILHEIGKNSAYEVIHEANASIRTLEFDESDALLIILTDNGVVTAYDLGNKKIAYQIMDYSINEAFIQNDSRRLITKSRSFEFSEWDLFTGKRMLSSIKLEGDDFLTRIPGSNYFMATKEACKKMYYVNKDLQLISFEQIDLKFNRPDLVLKSKGVKDSLLIEAYYKAYLKRIQKHGLDTLLLNDGYTFPNCQIQEVDDYSNDSKNGYLNLVVQLEDTMHKLDYFNVWVNEVPIFGHLGYSIRTLDVCEWDTTLKIELCQGKNRIDASVVNRSGIESFRSPLYVTYKSENTYNPKTHFIGIGIDKFSEAGHDLSYSVKDVRDLSRALKEKLGDQLTIDTLFNENVSVSNVQALKMKLLQTNINDKVIISYSGHGLLNEEYDYFLSAYNVDFHHPEKGGIPYEVLEDLLDSIPARKKLLLIDACHSGELDKEDFKEMAAVAGAKGIVKPKGGEAENTTETQTIGLQNSFQLMQELFVNVQKGSGATIISAAAGDQFALEGGKLENGFFTYAILKYMKDHDEVSINALKKYVYTEVENLSGGMQKPTSRIENLEMDWRVW